MKQRYIFSDSKNVTKDLIALGVDEQVPDNEKELIVLDMYCAKVSSNKSSADNLDYLRIVVEAPNENLLLEESREFTEALWELNKEAYFRYSLFYFFAYFSILGYVVLGLNSKIYNTLILA